MILTITLAYCGFVIIIAGILALTNVKKVSDRYTVKPYDTTIYPSQAVEIIKQIAAYKTNFTYYSSCCVSNSIEFVDKTNNDMILKVSKVSCYSDITGIKNHQGYLYSIIKDYVVLKNYISFDECMRDYQQNYCLYVKKGKITDRLKSLQEDF